MATPSRWSGDRAGAAHLSKEGEVAGATATPPEGELGGTTSPAAAAGPPRQRFELRVGQRAELFLAGAAVLLVGVGEQVATRNWEPDRCRWCATNPIDDGAREALRWSADRGRLADRLSDVRAYIVAPVQHRPAAGPVGWPPVRGSDRSSSSSRGARSGSRCRARPG